MADDKEIKFIMPYKQTKYLGTDKWKTIKKKYFETMSNGNRVSRFINGKATTQKYTNKVIHGFDKNNLVRRYKYSMPHAISQSIQHFSDKCSTSALFVQKYKNYSNYTKRLSKFNQKKKSYFESKYIVNMMSVYSLPRTLCNASSMNSSWTIYRCQFNTKEDSCCCSCNSDAMFEVMKSLYDCYKKKNCDHCNCILCGHLPNEERRIGELVKTSAQILAPSEIMSIPSAKMKKAKAEGLLTPLKGKNSEQKEKILRGLAINGIPLPKGKTASERKIVEKVRKSLGLPPEPKTADEKKTFKKAITAGLIIPLEGKTRLEKEKLLKEQADLGITLPEGRSASEKAIIAKLLEKIGPQSMISEAISVPSSKMKKAKAEGLLTPLIGKSPEQKENIVRGLAMNGIPLPKGKTASDKKIIDQVRQDLGLPPEPKTAEEKRKYKTAVAAGVIVPLEGKSKPEKEKLLKEQAKLGIPLPEGRTASEKALIAKVKEDASPPSLISEAISIPSAKIKKAKAEGFLTPLSGKSPKQKEKILRGLAINGIPLPKVKTASDQKIIDKVRQQLGLPPEPKTAEEKRRYKKAVAAGVITPLEGKSKPDKEKLLKEQADLGIILPEGRTASEKSLIAKVKKITSPPSMISEAISIPSSKMKKAKAEGLLTPFTGKSPEQKEKIVRGLAMNGIPLPKGKTASDKKIIDQVRQDLGLPPEPKTAEEKRKYKTAVAAGVIVPLEGKSKPEKEKLLKEQAKLGIPLPEGRTASEKALIAEVKQVARPPSLISEAISIPSAKIKKAKADGFLTPLSGKSTKQKEKILRGLAINGIPLPKVKTASDQKIIDKVRQQLGLPPEPKTAEEKRRYKKAVAAGVITPLEGKSKPDKEKLLKEQADLGIILPEGRTASEKSLIAKVKKITSPPSMISEAISIPSSKMKKAKAEGLLTPLTGKSPEQKEKIVRGLAMNGIPLPKGKTASDKKIIDQVRQDLGLPPDPKTAEEKRKYKTAVAAGVIVPLEGKSKPEKEKLLKEQAKLGIPLPEGRTASEKALIAKVKEVPRPPSLISEAISIPSAKIKKAKAEGFLTPLSGKSTKQKEKILRGLAINGIPLPKVKTASDQKIIDKVRQQLGLPPEPKTAEEKRRYKKAVAAGVITPLEGKSKPDKEKLLKEQADLGIILPEGRTASEKSLIAKVKKITSPPSMISEAISIPSSKMKKAKAEGLLTPLTGKSPEQKEKIVRGLAMNGIPFPKVKTASDQKIIDKVRQELGLPPEPKTAEEKRRYKKAVAAGVIIPLEGKSKPEKVKLLNEQADLGITLPEGRTSSEKTLIAKLKARTRPPSIVSEPIHIPSEKIKRAKAEGLLTPLTGKNPEQKEKIARGLAMIGIPLPKGMTASDKKIFEKVRYELGLPPEPKNTAENNKYKKAAAAGFIIPLEGKNIEEKKNILQRQAEIGISLPEGRTASEKALVARIKESVKQKPDVVSSSKKVPSEKMRKAMAEGFITPLEGKTKANKEIILTGLAMNGIPLPEGKSSSENELIAKVRNKVGLPPVPIELREKEIYNKAQIAGLITPLEGKSLPQKENLLREQAAFGLPLPKGRTSSEKALIQKILSLPKEQLILAGKPKDEKEKVLKQLVIQGSPLPEATTSSETRIIEKVRYDLGLPPEPKSFVEKDKYNKAQAAGIIVPLEGKNESQKEIILQKQADFGLELPEPRTVSERELIKKVRARKKQRSKVLPPEEIQKLDSKTAKIMTEGRGPSDECICDILTPESEKVSMFSRKRFPREIQIPSEKLRAARDAGLLTPLKGKSPEQKEKIVQGLVMQGIPLPEGETASEKTIIEKVRKHFGLPPEPKSSSLREKYQYAQAAGIITPLEGKTAAQKEKILTNQAEMGIPLPEGRSQSEKDLIKKVRNTVPKKVTSEKIRKAKAAGILTPIKGKTFKEKERILRALASEGLPFPKGTTASENKLIRKIKSEIGAGITIPIPSEKLNKAKAAGLLTPLHGKTDDQKETILKGLALLGIPLPKALTASEKKITDKVRKDIGLPPEPKTSSLREKYRQAQETGAITPLEGKSAAQKEKILMKQAEIGLSLPEGRTQSEIDLLNKVRATHLKPDSSERLRKARAAGLLTPIEGKPLKEKEKILRNLAKSGLPLPEGKTASDKQLIQKVRMEIGVPLEGIASEKLRKATAEGLLTPLEGKTAVQKDKILKGRIAAGLLLPETLSPSDKELVKKIKAAKSAGLLTPLLGKSDAQKKNIVKELALKGISLPKAQTASEKKIIDEVRKEVGLPPEPKTSSIRDKYRHAQETGAITPLEGKSAAQKEKILIKQAKIGIPLPEGRTQSEKDLINKVRTAIPKQIASERLQTTAAAGLLTPLEGKSPKEKEKILKSLAKSGLPLPEGKTDSDKQLIQRVRAEMGVPLEKIPSEKLRKAQAEGLITPLEGKTIEQKEKILKGRIATGLPLPLVITASDKELVRKIKTETGYVSTPKSIEKVKLRIPSEKLKAAKEAGFLTPLKGKSPEQKEKIVKELAKRGIPLPIAETVSEKNIIDKVRKDIGLPPEPKSSSLKEKYLDAQALGILTPLEGKTAAEKAKILTNQAEMGIPLPEGRTKSEKDLINKIRSTVPKKVTSEKLKKAKAAGLFTPLTGKPLKEKERILKTLALEGMPLPEGKTASEKKIMRKIKSELGLMPIPSEKLKKAKAAGLLTPLRGKTDVQKEKIVKDLALLGIPLPKAQTSSEKKIIDKVRKEVGLPPEPKTSSIRDKYRQAQETGVITPLEGKSAAQKETILMKQAEIGLPLPEGRTQSEKDLINKVRIAIPKQIASERLQTTAAAGLLTPLEGKSPKEKEKILKSLAKSGLPLPEGKTDSDKQLIQRVRAEMGVPLEKIPSEKLRKAQAEGLITPLEGKTIEQKEKILKGRIATGLPLPLVITASDKELVRKIKTETGYVSTPKSIEKVKLRIPSEKLKAAKEAGFLTPLKGKSPEQKEKIVKELAKRGIPLPIAETVSEKNIIDKVRKDIGLPPEPKSSSLKEKYLDAQALGILTPLEGKTAAEKAKILTNQAEMGIPLPEGRTKSEKDLINKIRSTVPKKVTSEKLKKAKAAGLFTPLTGKPLKEKERILKTLALEGMPLPEGKTASEKKLMRKIKSELGLMPIPSEKLKKAKAAGLLTPLRGKTDVQKEKIVKDLALLGIPLPKAQTSSEKKIIDKVRKEVGLPPEPKTSSIRDKYRQAQETGVITPLEGKSAAQKETILMKQAAIGLPLPEGRTQSEKELIAKVQEKLSKKFRASKKIGMMTPLAGKSADQKEKIIRDLANAGLPIPEGKTPSEKSLIKKVRVQLGLPQQATPSEKARKITKKVGISKAKTSEASIGVGAVKSKGGIVEEFEDIIKTTTCDRGCGCDRKKIRFKHSYVKIRVTSPDISSLCPCPNECVPGLKGGVFTDKEGIKVTVGQVTGTPSLRAININDRLGKYGHESNSYLNVVFKPINQDDKYDVKIKKSYPFSWNRFNTNQYKSYLSSESIPLHQIEIKKKHKVINSNESFYSMKSSIPINSEDSLESIYFGNTDSSISLKTKSSLNLHSIKTSGTSESDTSDNSSCVIENDLIDYLYCKKNKTNSLNLMEKGYTTTKYRNISKPRKILSERMISPTIMSISTQNICGPSRKSKRSKISESQQLLNALDEIISKSELTDSTSAYYVVMSSSSTDLTSSSTYSLSSQLSSTICIQLSENLSKSDEHKRDAHPNRRKFNSNGLKIATPMPQKENKYDVCSDTTEDRPCYCVINKRNEAELQCGKRNFMCKPVKPFTLSEPVTRGLNHETLGNNLNKSYECRPPEVYPRIESQHLTETKSCQCDFEKLKQVIENIGKQLISTACGGSTEMANNSRGTDYVKPTIKKTHWSRQEFNTSPKNGLECSSCSDSKIIESQKLTCRCGGQKRDIVIGNKCPCEEHALQVQKDDDERNSKYKSKGLFKNKNKQKSKKIKPYCECTPPEPEEDFDPIMYIDERKLRKFYSEMTQSLSGFKLNKARKVQESEISLDEALKILAKNYRYFGYGDVTEDKCSCDNDEDVQKEPVNVDCICPPKPDEPSPVPGPLKGIKLQIGGKGSTSKGLSGILCFDVQE